MSFRLIPKSVTLNDLERRNGVILRCFSEFGYRPGALTKSSRSLSHLLMSSCPTCIQRIGRRCRHAVIASFCKSLQMTQQCKHLPRPASSSLAFSVLLFSGPAFSTFAFFPVLHFPSLYFAPSFSVPVFNGPALLAPRSNQFSVQTLGLIRL